MKEVWKDICGYEGVYQVSNLGNIKSLPRKGAHGGLLKPSEDKNGYLCIGLNKNAKRKTFKVHRLVAMAFIKNPFNLPEINHKDENKKNNTEENLEWCDHVYNSRYGTRGNKIAKALSKGIYSVDECGNVEHFKSYAEAQRITGIYSTNIRCSVNGTYSKAGNRKWYLEDAQNSQIANND